MSTLNPDAPPEEITRDERTNAMLAHLLTIFAGFVAPGVIYIVKRKESRFVAFHALQAVLWHLVLFAVFFVGFISLFVVMFSTVALHRAPSTSPAHDGPPPPAFFLGFFGMWLVMMLGWASNVGFSIYLAVRANEGKWTRYPLVGRIAMRLGGFG